MLTLEDPSKKAAQRNVGRNWAEQNETDSFSGRLLGSFNRLIGVVSAK